MTWGKALPLLIVAGIFDVIRIFFEWFVFFGPALGAVACTAGVNSVVGTTVAATAGKLSCNRMYCGRWCGWIFPF